MHDLYSTMHRSEDLMYKPSYTTQLLATENEHLFQPIKWTITYRTEQSPTKNVGMMHNLDWVLAGFCRRELFYSFYICATRVPKSVSFQPYISVVSPKKNDQQCTYWPEIKHSVHRNAHNIDFSNKKTTTFVHYTNCKLNRWNPDPTGFSRIFIASMSKTLTLITTNSSFPTKSRQTLLWIITIINYKSLFKSVSDFNRCLGVFLPTKQKKQNQTFFLEGDASLFNRQRVVIWRRESSTDVDSTAGMVHQRRFCGRQRW